MRTGCDKSEECALVHDLENDLAHEATPEAQRQTNMVGEGFLANILQSRSTNSRAYNVAIHNDGKRPEFPSGMTSGIGLTISLWFMKRKRELNVAFAGGGRLRRSEGLRS